MRFAFACPAWVIGDLSSSSDCCSQADFTWEYALSGTKWLEKDIVRVYVMVGAGMRLACWDMRIL